MKKHIKLFGIVLILLTYGLTQTFVSAQQNVSADIQNINLAVFDAKYLQMDLSYQLFFDDALQSEMKGSIKKSGTSLFQQIGGITIIKNEPHCLFVDVDRKIMVLDPYYPKDQLINRDAILNLNIDTLKRHIENTEADQKGNQKRYTFILKRGQFSKIILEFNTKNYFLTKLTMLQREDYRDNEGFVHQVKMVINVEDINTKEKIADSNFDMSQYVNIDSKKKKYSVTSGYKSYKFNSSMDKTIKFK